jgi:phosphoglycolate phosphatase
MTVDCVLFDFDYTLADSSEAIIACVNYALRGLGLPEASPPSIRATIGLALVDALPLLAGPDQAGRGAEFARLFGLKADEIMAEQTTLYPQTPMVLRALKAAGLSVGIVTSKYRYRIERILPPELRARVDVIIGSEDVTHPKPHPEALLLAMDRLGAARERPLYVGDSPTDAQAAQRAGVAFAGVLSGVTPREAFDAYAVCVVLAHIGELPAWLLGG